jgi:hypothetical protein
VRSLFPKALKYLETANSNYTAMKKCGKFKIHNKRKLKTSTVGFRKKLEFITVHLSPVDINRNSLKEICFHVMCQKDSAADM